MPVISFRNFYFRYDNVKEPTLKKICLDIQAGEKVLIAGPSGSGKSTLAHCINGLIPFTYKGECSGSLEIKGVNPAAKSIYEISRDVGTILQDQDGQFVGLSVAEDVAFAYENNAVPQDEMVTGVEWALQEVAMRDYMEESPHDLSGGQKQKVSIAGILTTDAAILLFDEPLANLDPVSGQRAMQTINAIHRKTKKTVIVVEHRIEDVLEHDFDRIVIMSAGEIVAAGPPDEILATNLLCRFGLREPLYIEVLKRVKVPLRPEDALSQFENILKFKQDVLKTYQKPTGALKQDPKPAVLSLADVSYRYYEDSAAILKNVSFAINQGEMLAILGNNGAGKSTLLKIIAGIARQQNGTIRYLDQPIDNWSIRKRSEIIGYVMQNPNHMITKQMIFDEVAFGPRNGGCDETTVAQCVAAALQTCGLYQYRKWPVDSLSYGQKKRVTIAAILAMQPRVIILDEPTAGQDHRNYREFMGYLERIKETGISVVMITHDMHLALEYADRALVLCDGRVIAVDSVYRILSNQAILRQANLKETSLSRMARLYGVADVDDFIAFFVSQLKSGEENV